MIFTPDRRPKIILPATFSLSNPGDPVFNNTLLKETGPTAARFPLKIQPLSFQRVVFRQLDPGRRHGKKRLRSERPETSKIHYTPFPIIVKLGSEAK
jgi:hypothetical protein